MFNSRPSLSDIFDVTVLLLKVVCQQCIECCSARSRAGCWKHRKSFRSILFAAVGGDLLGLLSYWLEEQPFEEGQQLTGRENETISHLFPFFSILSNTQLISSTTYQVTDFRNQILGWQRLLNDCSGCRSISFGCADDFKFFYEELRGTQGREKKMEYGS